MHINGIIITKEFISHRNFKRLHGSFGTVHIHIDYIFLKSNEEIVVRNPKSKIFFIMYSVLSCLCVILLFIHSSHLSKSLGFIPPWREDHVLRLSFDARQRFA